MADRAILLKYLTDKHGDALAGATVTVRQKGTTIPITETMYEADDPDTDTLPNPLTSDDNGRILAYLDNSKRVDLYIEKPGHPSKTEPVDFIKPQETGPMGPVGSLPTGSIMAFGGADAPSGWLLCDGAVVSRATYADLYAVLGDAFGAGDGSTTFKLPDLRQRFPIGKAAAGTGSALGATGGTIDHKHAQPTHVHQIDPPATTSGGPSATTQVDQGGDAGQPIGPVASDTHTHSTNIAAFDSAAGGGDETGSANPPYQVVNFIVKT
jgi:microcystin-dependent protein